MAQVAWAQPPAARPTVTSISPNSGGQGTTVTVTINGRPEGDGDEN